ncbi:MAG TPA: ABC transporter ATP-binding protein [Trebonia sp.]|nr:ABC transporter ATP-binding protein [Trebonia sp.]
MSEPLLSVRDLRVYFHQRDRVVRAVDGVDLRLDPGKTLCLVGESGSGKSLTALSIMRLISPPGRIEEGSEIAYAGQDLVAASAEQMQSIRGNEISMIFQEPMSSLNPAHTVGAQIAEAVRLHRPVSKAAAAERALEMLRLVGVPDPRRRASDYPHQLSGGMRQRVMIAMALSCEPKLIIADEPTTALDASVQREILSLLRDAADSRHTAVLFISHDIAVVSEIASRVLVMYAGQVVEEIPVALLADRGAHPYTRALVASIPDMTADRAQPLATIEGRPPEPGDWPTGCSFADRCPLADAHCRAHRPPLVSVGEGRRAACWKPQADAAGAAREPDTGRIGGKR